MSINIRKHSPIIICFIASFFAAMFLIVPIINRINFINYFENEFNTNLEKLNTIGYDVSYDKFSKSYIPFTKVIYFKNLQIYNLFGEDDFKWNMGDIYTTVPFMKLNSFDINFSTSQSMVIKNKTRSIFLEKINIEKKYSNKISIKTEKPIIDNIINVEFIEFIFSKDKSSQIANLNLNIQNIKISDNIEFPLIRNISKFFVDLEIPKSFSLNSELSRIYVKKIIVRWEPLLLVGKGNLYLSSNKFDARLNTTSKGLIESLEMLNQDKTLNNDNFEILKIMMEPEAYKLRPNDKYSTTTSTLRIQNDNISINSVPILELKK